MCYFIFACVVKNYPQRNLLFADLLYFCFQDTKFFVYKVKALYEKGTQCAKPSSIYHAERTLRKPVGVCTTSVMGSTVIFSCDGQGTILQHVYYDQWSNKGTPGDCSGTKLYTLQIKPGCSEFDFGAMHSFWYGYCHVQTKPASSGKLQVQTYFHFFF